MYRHSYWNISLPLKTTLSTLLHSQRDLLSFKMSLPSLSLLNLVACAARHVKGRPWARNTDPLVQLDQIVVESELGFSLGLCSGPLSEANLEKRLARLNNIRGRPTDVDTLAIDGDGAASNEKHFVDNFDIEHIKVALGRLEKLLVCVNSPNIIPGFHFDNDSRDGEVISTAVFVIASVCCRLRIGFPTISGLPPLQGVPLHSIIEATTKHIWELHLQRMQSVSLPAPGTGTKPPFCGQRGAPPVPPPPHMLQRPFKADRGNIYHASTQATAPFTRHQQRAPLPVPSHLGSPSSSRSASTVQSGPRHTTPPAAFAAAPRLLGQDRPNEPPILAPGAVKPPRSFPAHEFTALLERTSKSPDSSPVDSFPPSNLGASDQRVASPRAAEPVSPSSVASHDSRLVDTPRSGHTDNDWEGVNWDKN